MLVFLLHANLMSLPSSHARHPAPFVPLWLQKYCSINRHANSVKETGVNAAYAGMFAAVTRHSVCTESGGRNWHPVTPAWVMYA